FDPTGDADAPVNARPQWSRHPGRVARGPRRPADGAGATRRGGRLRRAAAALLVAHLRLLLPATARPRPGRGPDARGGPAPVALAAALPAAGALRDVDLPHHAERRAQRPAFPAPASVRATGHGRVRRRRVAGYSTPGPRRGADPPGGARRGGGGGSRGGGRA